MARLANDAELLQDLVEIYREDYPILLRRIELAISRHNHSELEQAAHALKGLVSNFLHDPTTALALGLEKRSRSNEWDNIKDDFCDLKSATARLLSALDTLVAK